jgi:hypothetical protein
MPLRASIAALGIAFALVFLSPFANAWDFDSIAPPPAAPTDQYRTARQVFDAELFLYERWNAHDMEGYLDCFWNSPDLSLIDDADRYTGWQELREVYLRNYRNPADMGHVTTSRIQVLLVEADLALAVIEWVHAPAAPRHTVIGIDTDLLRRMNGRWKVVSSHGSTHLGL